MPMGQIVKLKVCWWVSPYLGLCKLGAALGISLDIDRIAETTKRGIRIGRAQRRLPSG